MGKINNTKWKVYNNKYLYLKRTKISNEQPNFVLQENRKSKINRTQRQQKEEIINIRAQINDNGNRTTILNINETKSFLKILIK